MVTLALILSGAAILIAVGAGAIARRQALQIATSAPKRLEEGLAAVMAKLEAVETEMEGHRSALVRGREEIAALLDTVEETLERTESKRRRIAASRSREEAPQIDPNSREGLVALARERGFEVA